MDILYDLMVKILEQEKIPEEWRESILIPIFKGKGDVQSSSDYPAIMGLCCFQIIKYAG